MTLFWLFLFQLVWSSTYVAMKLAMTGMPLGMVMILRYGIASAAFCAAGFLNFRERFTLREWGLILLVGLLNFTGSPFFQLTSLKLTLASDVAIMVSFEPMVAACLAAWLLKEKMERGTLLTFLIATLGVLILSTSNGTAGVGAANRLLGNSLFVFSLLFEGLCQVTSRHLVQKYHPFRLTAWMVFAGFLGNAATHADLLSLKHLAAIPALGWSMVLYLGLICTVMAYGGWAHFLKRIPVGHISLSIFLQPIFGTAIAAAVLGERLTVRGMAGMLIIIVSLLLWIRKHDATIRAGVKKETPA